MEIVTNMSAPFAAVCVTIVICIGVLVIWRGLARRWDEDRANAHEYRRIGRSRDSQES